MNFVPILWDYILISAPFLMLGLLAGGAINEYFPLSKVQNWFGKGKWSGVFKASLIGVPLPLCSCSVLPAAVTLKKNGASNGSTSSFLISTPETGIDSISITYAMMDLPMTLIRPISAFLTAFIAGVLQIIFNDDFEASHDEKTEVLDDSCCPSEKEKPADRRRFKRLRNIFTYAFTNLLEDISLWLLFGLIFGAAVTFFVPEDLFLNYNGPYLRFLILLIGIPLYICASATTPIAASLVLKGMSPGIALLLLLVGPATNISNILVMQKFIGKKGVVINTATIIIVALALSYLIDGLYLKFAWPLDFKIGSYDSGHTHFLLEIISVIFCLILARALYIKEIGPRFFKSSK